MAYYRKCAAGWRVQIDKRGVRKSGTFPTKAAAVAWATQVEAEVIEGAYARWPRKTVADALDRYAKEASPTKGTHKQEVKRLEALKGHDKTLAGKIISEVSTDDLGKWRDARLKVVSASSVLRDLNCYRAVFNLAAKEWGWLPYPTPWSQLKAPKEGEPRDRLIRWQEARRILRSLGYVTGQPPITATQAVGYAFLLALRTAMRSGELVSLTGEMVDLKTGVVTLRSHKTAAKVGTRHIPLTPHGKRLLRLIWARGKLLPVTAATLDALFRRHRNAVLLDDIHFHDTRATALTHLSRKVDVLTLARISGHQDLSLLHRVYYRETAAEIAARLAAPRR